MTDNTFASSVVATHPRHQARLLRTETPHGCFTTPIFMPVGTRAAVNCLSTRQLQDTGSQIILGGNTYHMLLAPGLEVIQAAGGMHPFMGWSGPMLTDSGGFQLYSLSQREKLCYIDEDGANFTHPSTGQRLRMTAETSIATQRTIGADIIMAFDQCMPDDLTEAAAAASVARTHRWLLRSIAVHEQAPSSLYGHRQALFGIIQGGTFRHLREQSADFVIQQALDGIAIGGESIGFDMAKTRTIIQWLQPYLPQHKLRYSMGVGMSPQDIIDVVALGIDMFDCVAPTRNARHGSLYSGDFVFEDQWVRFESSYPRGRIAIKQARYAYDDEPLMPGCPCHTCQHYSRAELHYAYKQRSVIYFTLACLHNVSVMQQACYHMQSCLSAMPDTDQGKYQCE